MSSTPSSGAPRPQDLPGPLPTPSAVPPSPAGPREDSGLTGTWIANDGGMYFLRQIGDTLWWLGLSGGLMHPGLQFCNVFNASVTRSAVTGEWSDVPRGATSGRGTLTLRPAGDNQLLRVAESGGFGASIWRRTSTSQWPVIAVYDALTETLKNVVKNGHEKSTLADNLWPLRDSVSVFASIARSDDHARPAVDVSYPRSAAPVRRFTYTDFICLNEPAARGVGEPQDGNVGFWFLTDLGQITGAQPDFYAGVEYQEGYIRGKLGVPIEGDVIMFGRPADCGAEHAETSPPLFPGWAERAGGSAVLFNGRPIQVIVPAAAGDAPADPNFLTELSFGDPVRVTGVLVFDNRHGNDDPDKLEIHPVYSVDKITATFSANLSGAWTDDVGNTYYLRHDPADNSVWHAGMSPLGRGAYGQVFRGSFHPGQAAAPAGTGGPPIPPQGTVTGDVIAIEFGYGAAPVSGATGSRIGDTGAVTFELGRAKLAGREVPMLAAGALRLMKLYDA
jgi:hypothetical protein